MVHGAAERPLAASSAASQLRRHGTPMLSGRSGRRPCSFRLGGRESNRQARWEGKRRRENERAGGGIRGKKRQKRNEKPTLGRIWTSVSASLVERSSKMRHQQNSQAVKTAPFFSADGTVINISRVRGVQLFVLLMNCDCVSRACLMAQNRNLVILQQREETRH